MKTIAVRGYMTSAPHTIGVDQTIAVASRIMNEHRIRHLPVLSGGKLVGMVSQRDLRLVESLRDVDPELITVEEAMSPEPYTIGPDAPLEQVANEMAQHKYGSTVVVENDKVVGVFTTLDALRALQHVLRLSRSRTPRAVSARRKAVL